ncbi:MAG: fumarate hydratase [Deltaproteobacteria bacterium]|nr:MAG: fumarate hydratase [Deltaproteobacteria bacterium]
MNLEQVANHILELIRKTSTDLPADVENALRKAAETEQGRARTTLDLILKNVEAARESSTPICQDTGSLLFFVEHGPDVAQSDLQGAIEGAVVEATRRNWLRPNAVDPITGMNSGNNLGAGSPYVHFEQVNETGRLEVRLMLKGGGSENCGVQYALPDSALGAGRDVRGIKRCLVDAVVRAQGFGCAPGTLGVGIGGDRMTSYLESKLQLLRPLDDTNPDPVLADIEREMLEKLNGLGIGPMGFGGKTTLLGLKIGKRHRLPACFFVSVSYMCWAYRRRRLLVDGGGATID